MNADELARTRAELDQWWSLLEEVVMSMGDDELATLFDNVRRRYAEGGATDALDFVSGRGGKAADLFILASLLAVFQAIHNRNTPREGP